MHVEEGVDHVGCKQSSISILKKVQLLQDSLIDHTVYTIALTVHTFTVLHRLCTSPYDLTIMCLFACPTLAVSVRGMEKKGNMERTWIQTVKLSQVDCDCLYFVLCTVGECLGTLRCWNFRTISEARDRAGIELQYRPASLFSLAGRYDNPIPAGSQVLTDCSKIPARLSLSAFCELDVQSFTVARWNNLLPYSTVQC